MTFSMKGKATQSSNSNGPKVDWSAFNQHLLEKINEATSDGEDTNQVCFISGIVDAGLQPPAEPYKIYDEATEGDDNYEKQQKLLEADFGCYVEDGKFYIPEKKVQGVIFFVDFPDIKIDYSKFFGTEEEPLPYRTLLAGEWDNIAQITQLTPSSSGYGSKSRISKLAKATGCTKGLPTEDFDIGELLGKPFTMDITATTGGDKGQYLNIKVSNIASKHKAIPVPEHSVVPFGASFEGGNDEESVKQFARKGAILRRLELAEGWGESGLSEDIKAYLDKGSSGSSTPQPEGDNTPEPEPEVEEDNFDDNIPF